METGEAERAAERDVEARIDHLCRFYMPATAGGAVAPPDCTDGPRVGFIGSERACDALAPHVRLTLLTRGNWQAHLHARTLDAILVEPTAVDLAGQWSGEFFSAGGLGREIGSLLDACREAGTHVFAWLDCRAEDAALHLPLLVRAGTVFCGTEALADRLRGQGVTAEAVGTAAPAPAWRPYSAGQIAGQGGLRIACTDLASSARHSGAADLLASLLPFGLELFEAEEELTRETLSAADDVREGIRGCLLPGELPGLFASIDVLLQVDAEEDSPAIARGHALSAAASGALVVVLGEPGAADPRTAFAHVFRDPSDLRAFLSRLAGDEVERARLARTGWRSARQLQRTSGPGPALRRAAGCDESAAPVRISLVAVPPDAEAAAALLADFRAREGGGHELLLFRPASGDAAWSDLEAGLGEGERVVRLPEELSDGAALLLGASVAGGDYVLVSENGVRLGPRLLPDLALALSAGRPHLAIKPETYAASEDGRELLRRTSPATAPAAVAMRRERVAALVDPRDTVQAALSAVGGAALRLGLTAVVTDGLDVLRRLDAAHARDGWQAAETAHGPEGVFL